MALADVIERFDVPEVRELTEAVREGEIDDATQRALRTEFASASQEDLALLIRDRPDFQRLLDALEVATPEPAPGAVVMPPELLQDEEITDAPDTGEVMALSGEEREAVERVEALAEFTRTRSVEHYERLLQVLQNREPNPRVALTEDTLETIPDNQFDRLIGLVEDSLDQKAVNNLSLADIPGIEQAIRRRGGRDAAYFQEVLDELDEGEPVNDKLPEDELDLLMRNEDLLREVRQTVRQHRNDLDRGTVDRDREGQGQAPGDDPTAPDVIDRAAEELVDRLTGDVDLGQGAAEGIIGGALGGNSGGSAEAERLVPDTERRTDWRGDEFTADPQVEKALVKLQVEAEGDTGPFHRSYFTKTRPERRDPKMKPYAQHLVRNKGISVEEAISAGLPAEWFEGMVE